jgi:hypothetical protein
MSIQYILSFKFSNKNDDENVHHIYLYYNKIEITRQRINFVDDRMCDLLSIRF